MRFKVYSLRDIGVSGKAATLSKELDAYLHYSMRLLVIFML